MQIDQTGFLEFEPRILVFSGGTGTNDLVSSFQTISPLSTYVLPISDNGGSTSEIIRIFGGVGIGDIKSRLIKLIPEDNENIELIHIKRLLKYRLSINSKEAYYEWQKVVEGSHVLWENISSEKVQLIRMFFIYFQTELTKRIRHNFQFDFSNGSLGNLFLTGANLFFGSLESAIFLFQSITHIHAQVLPIISTPFTHHIAAKLKNGMIIYGQNQISHPSNCRVLNNEYIENNMTNESYVDFSCVPLILQQDTLVQKNNNIDLPSPIEYIFYIDSYGNRIYPTINPKILSIIKNTNTIIYGPGSLYTSLLPCLIVNGVAKAILDSPQLIYKIVFLNGSTDRETGEEFTGMDFIRALITGLVTHLKPIDQEIDFDYWIPKFITHIIYIRGEDTLSIDENQARQYGLKCIGIYGYKNKDNHGMLYDAKSVHRTLKTILYNQKRGLRQRIRN
ncbi:hypothetical protein PMAC_000141 [Pneumocystis sp. 'macacae']|nr:hypothetical protein PMAC_000141 [Pneumocystis sp. 'macacae']